MIKTQNLTPEIYYKKSRDFQLLGRICDFVFNYLKNTNHAVENNIISDVFDYKLINLVACTLGFKKMHDYDSVQLKAFCTAFSSILRNKGNLKSIEMILNILANEQNIKDNIEVTYDSDLCELQVWVPESLKELSLFEDTLDYILPAGISYIIVRGTLKKQTQITYQKATTKISNEATHAMSKSQVYNGFYEENTKLTDSYASRIDNMTLLKALESGEEIKEYVNNDWDK